MDLKTQRRMAASILKAGKEKVWLDPDELESIAASVTKDDIKKLINQGVIQLKRDEGTSSFWSKKRRIQKAKGRRKGHGSRSGAKGARFPKKKRWISIIRPIRQVLKELREAERIDGPTYRKLYVMAKGGMFKSRAHLDAYLKDNKIIEEI
ncbi:MAG: 50S ribosomal protein L19e [Candidatus Hydrothermarchaeales archaeon]